jgi:hypothetical protein
MMYPFEEGFKDPRVHGFKGLLPNHQYWNAKIYLLDHLNP